MKAVITWAGGETTIDGACLLGDPRVADEIDRLARAGVSSGVMLWFDGDGELPTITKCSAGQEGA